MEDGLSDKLKYQREGLRWLQEMQLVSSPQLINNLKLNLFAISRHIRDCEMLISNEHKAILIWLELGWFGRKFYRESIISESEDIIQQMLPSFKLRVVTDKAILDLAVKRVKEMLGGSNEDLNTSSTNDTANESGEGLQEQSSVLPDSEEQSEDRQESSIQPVDSNREESDEA